VDPYHELPKFDDPFAEWDAADEAAVAAAHDPLPRPHRRTRAPTHSRRTSDVEAEPHDYHEIPDSDEDEDTSDDGAQDDDE
jgi:hypothetical protein